MAHIEEKEENKQIAQDCLDKADSLITNNIRDAFINLSADTIIMFTETALLVPLKEYLAEKYIDLFFQRNLSKG